MIKRKKENKIVGNMIVSLLIAYTITSAGVLLIALCLLLFRLTMVQVEGLIFFLYLLSSFSGGIWVGNREKGNPFFLGMATGGLYYSCFLFMSYFQKAVDPKSVIEKIEIVLFILFFGGVGGFLGRKISYIRQKKSFMLYCSNATIGKK